MHTLAHMHTHLQIRGKLFILHEWFVCFVAVVIVIVFVIVVCSLVMVIEFQIIACGSRDIYSVTVVAVELFLPAYLNAFRSLSFGNVKLFQNVFVLLCSLLTIYQLFLVWHNKVCPTDLYL